MTPDMRRIVDLFVTRMLEQVEAAWETQEKAGMAEEPILEILVASLGEATGYYMASALLGVEERAVQQVAREAHVAGVRRLLAEHRRDCRRAEKDCAVDQTLNRYLRKFAA